MGGIIAAEEVSDIQAGEALATERPDVKVTAEGEGAGTRGRSLVDVKLCLQSNQGDKVPDFRPARHHLTCRVM